MPLAETFVIAQIQGNNDDVTIKKYDKNPIKQAYFYFDPNTKNPRTLADSKEFESALDELKAYNWAVEVVSDQLPSKWSLDGDKGAIEELKDHRWESGGWSTAGSFKTHVFQLKLNGSSYNEMSEIDGNKLRINYLVVVQEAAT